MAPHLLVRVMDSPSPPAARRQSRAARLDRLLRLRLQALARPVLPDDLPATRWLDALYPVLPHRRAEQHLLHPARRADLRAWRDSTPARLLLRGQSQPLHHPHEEAQGPGRAAGPLFDRADAARAQAGPHSLPASAALALRRRSAWTPFWTRCRGRPACHRGPRPKLAQRHVFRRAPAPAGRLLHRQPAAVRDRRSA